MEAAQENPDTAQRRAARPDACAWVAASAGSGKTKVLTDRVLRLLLPRADGAPGTPAHKIWCLTFTKAGAGEMAVRLRQTLARWAAAQDLAKPLTSLLGGAPTAAQVAAARRLLAQVLDAPGGGVQILTIHAFCQSVLGRFALEAGLAPGFTALGEVEAREILGDAASAVLAQAWESGDSLRAALDIVGGALGEDGFEGLVGAVASERRNFAAFLGCYKDFPQALHEALRAPQGPPDAVLRAACEDISFDVNGLRAAAQVLIANEAAKTDPPRGRAIADWLAGDVAQRAKDFDTYCSVFLKQDGTVRSKLTTRGSAAALDILVSEASRLEKLKDALRALGCAQASAALTALCAAILERYTEAKAQQGALDYDDMILKTLDLLGGATMSVGAAQAGAWVQYKLDQGIDHLLVDEAQDTNPEQWAIIQAITAEFFAGEGAREGRTLFAVGDVKQSIFGFQRAAPQAFDAMRQALSQKARAGGLGWEDVDLAVSFRSAPAVLRAVDCVFADEALLGMPAPRHRPHRTGAAGLVELWPPIVGDTQTQEATSIWESPRMARTHQTGPQKMADRIADTIADWIENKEILPDRGRPVTPGDILILLRSRGALAVPIVRALKARGVPVSGMDRLRLTEHLAVQDLLAAARFALLPADDLSLASVLKSPLVGWNDDALFAVAHGRAGALWAALAGHEIAPWLEGLIRRATAGADPFSFFSSILEGACPANSASGRRAIWARLGTDALEPVEEFASLALAHDGHLQGFMAALEASGGAEVKREMAEAAGEVRVMTVHGSKGLQAPVVILPDTVVARPRGTTQADARLVWSPDGAPLWSPSAGTDCAAFVEARAARQAAAEREEWRLAYVAMTRAEDRLYIGACHGKAEPRPESWYHAMRRGLEAAGAREAEGGGLRLADPVQAAPAVKPAEPRAAPPVLPAWLHTPARREAFVPPAIAPSQMAEAQEEAVARPPDSRARRRGEVVHGLLQLLPSLPESERRDAGLAFARARGEGVQTVDSVLAVIADPRFAQVFGPDALAEVAVAGRLPGGQMASGRIDRLVLGPEAVTIVDFKTGRGDGENAVPDLYRRQMDAYRDLVSQMYPGRAVRCALLYTDGPTWIEL